MPKKRVRRQTVTQQIMGTVTEKLQKYQHDKTRKQYMRQVKKYVKFCREKFDSKTFSDCEKNGQEYSDFLQSENYTASTVHTYLAAVCAVFGVDLSAVKKPVRHVADYVRGRNARRDIENEKWAYIVEFQRRVGIRREELKHLRGKDFAADESGFPCVVVRRGKGGKLQYQRISGNDVEFIKAYFEAVPPEERIFEGKYFENDLNFHALRAECAKKYYFEQEKRMKENPEYRKKLEREIRKRWETMNLTRKGKPKKFKESEIAGTYFLRGKNRELALKRGLPLSYDKTALLATSIFKLSHWRNDVTVASYILA